MKIEFYQSVSNRNNHKSIEIDRLLNQSVKSETLKQKTYTYRQWLKDNPKSTPIQKSEQKVKSFTGVQFGGTFCLTGKSKDVLQMSGLIVLDFDHIDQLESIRESLRHDNHTYILFVSPSGDGLKLIVKHDLKDPVKWSYLYQELEQYYKEKFNLITDPSGKDISRMCFIPFIDNLYRNDKSEVWNYKGTFEQTETETENNLQTEITDDIYRECFYLSTFLSDNKINICENYNDWLSYGYSLCTLGENGRMIFHHISSVSKKYNYRDTDKQFSELLETFDPDRTDINKYLYRSKMSIVEYILYNKYGFRTE